MNIFWRVPRLSSKSRVHTNFEQSVVCRVPTKLEEGKDTQVKEGNSDGKRERERARKVTRLHPTLPQSEYGTPSFLPFHHLTSILLFDTHAILRDTDRGVELTTKKTKKEDQDAVVVLKL